MADNIRKVDMVDVELNDGNLHRNFLAHSIGMRDSDGDAFGVALYRNGNPVDLSGAHAQGYFRNPLGEVIAVTNNVISGNKAIVILPRSCYEHEGEFSLAIKVIGGSVTGTMRIVDGVVLSNPTLSSIAPASMFNFDASTKGWCYMWNEAEFRVETITGEQWGQTHAIPVVPGQRIEIANVTPGTDIYSVILLGSTDIGNTLTGTVAFPAVIGDESIYIYEVPPDAHYITVGFLTNLKDKIYIGPVKTERDGDVTAMNLFNPNAYYTGWLYQPAAGGGVEKNFVDFFGQTNVMAVSPGDLINIYGATPNAEMFFVTTHNSNNIDDTNTAYQVFPIKSMDGLSFSQFHVPQGISFISVGFLHQFAGRMDVYVGQKTNRAKSVEVSFLGDSITQGYIAPNVWANPNLVEIVGNRLNCLANNYGLVATSICEGSSEAFVARLGRMTESYIDCLVIFGGTNDYGDLRAQTIGQIGDQPARGTNFIAAFKFLIESAMDKFPMAQILVVTPMRRNVDGPNQYGISLEDIVYAEIEVAKYYGIKCYDFYHEGGINPGIGSQRVKYTSDGLHPNQEGINRFVGPCIATAVEQLVMYRG